jgi:OFA family oxalate/formate antiporter-like MFS transporter
MAHDAFISYSSKDKPTADAVCATLESRGIRCWIAPRDVLPGEEYAASIINAIHESRLLVLVFSSGANQSPQVLREVERAVSRGLPILPLRIENVSPSASMEYYISSQHWLDALTEPMERHLVHLADTVTLLLGRMSKSAGPAEPLPAVKPVPPVVIEEPIAPTAPPKIAPTPVVVPPPAPPSIDEATPPKKIAPRKETVTPLRPASSVGDSRKHIAIAAIFMQFVLGAYYSWGALIGHLESAYHWSQTQVSSLFTVANLTFGLACLAGGLWMRKSGSRKVARVAGILFGGGIFLAAFSGSFGEASFAWFSFTYCFLGAVGLGFGFIVCLATVLQWFPEKRGLMVGVAGAAFGLGTAVVDPVIASLVRVFALSVALVALGIGSLIAILIAARFLRDASPQSLGPTSTTLRQALGRWHWYALCAILFVTMGASIALISGSYAMSREIGISTGFLVLADPLGQFLWGWISDRTKRGRLLLALLVIQGLLLLMLPAAHSVPAFSGIILFILFCNGGSLAVIAAFTTDYFGSEHIAAIFGSMQAAGSIAMIVSPILVAEFGGTSALYVFAALLLAVAALPLLVRPPRMNEAG